MKERKGRKGRTGRKGRKSGVTHQVPTGWTHVTGNDHLIVAPDTYVDALGVLRSAGDDSCVVWHLVVGGVHCERRGITPDQITYDPATGAPWCPDCWGVKKFREVFGAGVFPDTHQM